jgi:hypothetical protein
MLSVQLQGLTPRKWAHFQDSILTLHAHAHRHGHAGRGSPDVFFAPMHGHALAICVGALKLKNKAATILYAKRNERLQYAQKSVTVTHP